MVPQVIATLRRHVTPCRAKGEQNGIQTFHYSSSVAISCIKHYTLNIVYYTLYIMHYTVYIIQYTAAVCTSQRYEIISQLFI